MKKLLLGILFLVITCVVSMGADWKKCNTELIIANKQDTLFIYSVRWLDHDIEKFKGMSIQRCAGEIAAYTLSNISESDFRLCPGRHIVIWHKRGHAGVYSYYMLHQP